MSIELRLPNITANTDAGKLIQIQSYLYQTVQQLNYALGTIESGTSGKVLYTGKGTGGAGGSGGVSPEDAVVTFNSLKGLIIKSADIVNAYYDVINTRLEGLYVAQSDFGTYTEETAQDIEANSTSIQQLYTNMQEIVTDIENVEHTLIEVNAHIKTGLLYYDDDGVPVYGLEVGQRTEVDGEEVFNKYARFTSEKLSFYDQNGTEVAYISDRKLYITDVEITGSFHEGGFVDYVQTDKSIVTKWVGD